MDAISASDRARPGARRQAFISYQLSGAFRGMMTVIVSVPRRVAHQPPLVLVSLALRPAMVVFAWGRGGDGKPSALQLTRTPPAGSAVTG